MNATGKKGPRGQYDRRRIKFNADLSNYPGDTVFMNKQIIDSLLKQRQILLIFQT